MDGSSLGLKTQSTQSEAARIKERLVLSTATFKIGYIFAVLHKLKAVIQSAQSTLLNKALPDPADYKNKPLFATTSSTSACKIHNKKKALEDKVQDTVETSQTVYKVTIAVASVVCTISSTSKRWKPRLTWTAYEP